MVQQVRASIVSSTQLNDTIWRYILKPEQIVPYAAGQYLQVQRKDKDAQFYSIANAPQNATYYELHVRHRDHQIWDARDMVSLSLPFGTCDLSHLHQDKPILFLAVGTGFAPIRAMIEQLLWQADPRKMKLFWGVAVENDWYDPVSLQTWQDQSSDFHYHPYLAAYHQSELVAHVLARYPEVKDWQVVMAGPFELMHQFQQKWLAQGLEKSVIFSDAFAFASY